MSETIFDGATTPTEPVVPEVTPTNTIPQELVDLVGENKKYKTVEDALKSVAPAQAHISKLEAELAQLKEQITT